MDEILLSFNAKDYPNLKNTRKIYEHRKRFCDKEVKAYVYVSYPIKQIMAIIELGRRTYLKNWLELYRYDENATNRINGFLERNNYVMEIKSFVEIEPIHLKDLQDNIPGFQAPHSFHYLKNNRVLEDYIRKNIYITGSIITNDFSNITANDVCQY